MRLSLILTAALTALVLSGCDQLPRIAVLPPKSGDCCQCATPAKSACPTTTAAAPAAVPAAKIPAEPVMEAEAPTAPVQRRHVVRAHSQAQVQVRRQTLTYAGGPAPAPAYDGQVYVPETHAYARVDAQETRTERYSERQESYGYVQGGHAQGAYVENGYAQGGYVQGGYVQSGYAQGGPPRGPCPCGPTPAAGRDRDGFLTWPGKLAQRP
ncbi:hypothetical protein [Phenylobacterium conjunctum]|jgi:hypothetical protein|uniref:Uncharacterized protein n=1 Tax=Phenylobacterium conjunctum TaxID=1298959 RepID=A0ABW3T2B1_9CAUL